MTLDLSRLRLKKSTSDLKKKKKKERSIKGVKGVR